MTAGGSWAPPAAGGVENVDGAGSRGNRRRRRRSLPLHPRDELRIRVGGQNPGELGAIIHHEAHTVDNDVLHLPDVTLVDHPVQDGKLLTAPGQERGRHGCRLAVDGLAQVLDLYPAGHTGLRSDHRDEAPLEKNGEQPGEGFLILRNPREPHGAEGDRGGGPEIENLIDKVADGLARRLESVGRLHG